MVLGGEWEEDGEDSVALVSRSHRFLGRRKKMRGGVGTAHCIFSDR